ncbi:MAG: TIGR01620 family protein [Hyphomicrobiaceae bacterium]
MTAEVPRRKPEAFRLDDPDLVERPPSLAAEQSRQSSGPGDTAPAAPNLVNQVESRPRLMSTSVGRPMIRWGAILIAALGALGGLAVSLTFARFVAIAFERQDAFGWMAFGLLAIAALAFLAILARETFGILRLRRLGRHKRALQTALTERDAGDERRALARILGDFDRRPELKWALADLDQHARGVHDPGDLTRLADRDVMPMLDGDARRLIAASAKRVSVVTALSPMALITVAWVLVENLRLLRGLAALYGGRPGFIGSLRLARMVLGHIIATGGVALTDDLLGQFLGQDLIRRLSRRLGESVFNAALTARVGAAAIDVIRPLPFLAAPPIRARDMVAEVIRAVRATPAAPGQSDPARPPPRA